MDPLGANTSAMRAGLRAAAVASALTVMLLVGAAATRADDGVRVTDPSGDASPDVVALTATPSATSVNLVIEFAEPDWVRQLTEPHLILWVEAPVGPTNCVSGYTATYFIEADVSTGHARLIRFDYRPQLDSNIDGRRLSITVPYDLIGHPATVGFRVWQPDHVPDAAACLTVTVPPDTSTAPGPSSQPSLPTIGALVAIGLSAGVMLLRRRPREPRVH